MKKIIVLILFNVLLYSNTTQNLEYMKNINTQKVYSELKDKLNILTYGIESYIVSTTGKPYYDVATNKMYLLSDSSGVIDPLILEELYTLSGIDKDVLTTLNGSTCVSSVTNSNICAGDDILGIKFSIEYYNNMIPFGVSFNIDNLFGSNYTLSSNFINDLSLSGFTYVSGSPSKLIYYFNDKEFIAQMYSLKKQNNNIIFGDVSNTLPTSYPANSLIYSPNGIGGFYIYSNANNIWNLIGEPVADNIVSTTADLTNLELPLNSSVTVMNEDGYAIEYESKSIDSSISGGAATGSNNDWEKNIGNYEKNYSFQEITVSGISLAIPIGTLQALGNWDSHTKLDNIDLLKLDYIVNDKAQILDAVFGVVNYHGGHTTNTDGRLYFEIDNSELNQIKTTSDCVNDPGCTRFIGHNYDNPNNGDVWIANDIGGAMVDYTNPLSYTSVPPEYTALQHRCTNFPGTSCTVPISVYTYEVGRRACHHNLQQCIYIDINSMMSGIKNSPVSFDLSCNSDIYLGYKDANSSTMYPLGTVVHTTVTPETDGSHTINYGSPVNKTVSSFSFDLTYIDGDTFGGLSCVEKGASNY